MSDSFRETGHNRDCERVWLFDARIFTVRVFIATSLSLSPACE